VFFRDGPAKPAFQAFRFPFGTERLGKRKRGRVRAWGKAPSSGAVVIEARRRGGWKKLKRVRAGGNRVFFTSLRLRGAAMLRARMGSETSLTWRQR
jgi:hypothetical protein